MGPLTQEADLQGGERDAQHLGHAVQAVPHVSHTRCVAATQIQMRKVCCPAAGSPV